MKYKYGVAVGRFQPFHKGHLYYVNEAKKRCDFLFIGITTPGDKPTKYEPQDPSRLGKINNPFSFKERKEMISLTLKGLNYDLSKVKFVEFRPGSIEAWHKRVPKDAVYFLLLLPGEGKKVEEMNAQGLKTEVIKTLTERNLNANKIREDIISKKNWKKFLPKPVALYLERINAQKRIRLSLKAN